MQGAEWGSEADQGGGSKDMGRFEAGVHHGWAVGHQWLQVDSVVWALCWQFRHNEGSFSRVWLDMLTALGSFGWLWLAVEVGDPNALGCFAATPSCAHSHCLWLPHLEPFNQLQSWYGLGTSQKHFGKENSGPDCPTLHMARSTWGILLAGESRWFFGLGLWGHFGPTTGGSTWEVCHRWSMLLWEERCRHWKACAEGDGMALQQRAHLEPDRQEVSVPFWKPSERGWQQQFGPQIEAGGHVP